MIAFIVEILFFGFCGWLGHVAVKIVTLGKVDLDYGDSSESVITEWIGVGVFLAIAMLISFLINANRDKSSVKLMSPSRQFQCCTPHEQSLPSNSLQTIQEDRRTLVITNDRKPQAVGSLVYDIVRPFIFMKLKLEIEVDCDMEAMHRNDPDSIKWFRDAVLLNPAEDEELILNSNCIGDEIGTVRVTRIISGLSNDKGCSKAGAKRRL